MVGAPRSSHYSPFAQLSSGGVVQLTPVTSEGYDDPLLVAVSSKDLTLTEWLLKRNVNPNTAATGQDGFSSVHAAVSNRIETYALQQ